MRHEFFDRVKAQGEQILKKSAQSLQLEIQQGLSHLAEQKANFGEEYSATASPFVSVHINRQYEKEYHGDVFVWDIDKTYLQTHFSSLKGLAAIPFESAEDKKAVPGTVPLLQALHRGMEKEHANLPVYFVSGSPPQLRQVIQEKMQLDGVHFDGLMFKDQLGLIRAGRPRDVKKQLGYKLSALLTLKASIPGLPRFYCFGDDVESDAEVFSLYAKVMKGMSKENLLEHLTKAQVHEHDISYIFSILEKASMQESIEGYRSGQPVGKIFIHLERRTNPANFNDELVHASYNFLQTAMLLTHMKLIPESCLELVVEDMRKHGVSDLALAIYASEAIRRFSLPESFGQFVFSS